MAKKKRKHNKKKHQKNIQEKPQNKEVVDQVSQNEVENEEPTVDNTPTEVANETIVEDVESVPTEENTDVEDAENSLLEEPQEDYTVSDMTTVMPTSEEQEPIQTISSEDLEQPVEEEKKEDKFPIRTGITIAVCVGLAVGTWWGINNYMKKVNSQSPSQVVENIIETPNDTNSDTKESMEKTVVFAGNTDVFKNSDTPILLTSTDKLGVEQVRVVTPDTTTLNLDGMNVDNLSVVSPISEGKIIPTKVSVSEKYITFEIETPKEATEEEETELFQKATTALKSSDKETIENYFTKFKANTKNEVVKIEKEAAEKPKKYVVDKEAWVEVITPAWTEHKLVKKAYDERVLISPAETKILADGTEEYIPAQYETIHHDAEYVDIEHPAVEKAHPQTGHYE